MAGVQYTPDVPYPARFLVYVNGVRIPAEHVNVSSGIFQPLRGSITVPAHRLMARLGAEDRVQVAVFYLDVWYHRKDPQWCLLFEAEIHGWAYANTGGKKKITFSVQSNLSVLSQLFMYFMSGESSKVGTKAKSSKDHPNQLKMKGKYPKQLFTPGLSGRGSMARPFDIIENVLFAVLGEHRAKVLDVATKSSDVTAEYKRLQALSVLTRQKQLGLAQERRERELGRGLTALEETQLAKGLEEAESIRMDDKLKFYKNLGSEWLNASEVAAIQTWDLDDKVGTVLRLEAKQSVRRRSLLSKSITQSGFFARYMRLTRFLEHWVASPYVEGRPDRKDPLGDILGGGVFPLLRSVKAKKVFNLIARQSGIKYGERANIWNMLAGVFSLMSYEVVEVMAPPAMTLDRYGLPKTSFDKSRPEDLDPDGEAGYAEWAKALVAKKERLAIGSFVTKPELMFGMPPSCNTWFPAMWETYQYGEDYQAHPTRVYFNRKGPLRKLNLKGSLPGYAASTSRVGFPAVVDGHVQKASQGADSDMEFLVFPEEYYRGPRPNLKDLPLAFLNIDSVASSRRFSRPANDPDLGQVASEEQEGNAIYAATLAQSVRSSESQGNKGHSMHALYFLLAQKEYYKARYAQNSGMVSGAFNPYAALGYPMAVFDEDAMGVHTLSTALSVAHTLGESGFNTTVNFGYGRTFEEMFEDLYADGEGLDMAPADPVAEIQDLFQITETANQYYSLLFRMAEVEEVETSADKDSKVVGASGELLRTAVMDYKKLVGWNLGGSGEDFPIAIRETDKGALEELFPDARIDVGAKIETPVVPLSTTRPMFESLALGLEYASRPVCTLEQYIDFYKMAGRGTQDLDMVGRGRGIRVGEVRETGLPRYYNVIRQFVGGPGVEPGSKVADLSEGIRRRTGLTNDNLELTVNGPDGPVVFTVVKSGARAKFADLPDSRKDWQAALLRYLQEVLDPVPGGDTPGIRLNPPLR